MRLCAWTSSLVLSPKQDNLILWSVSLPQAFRGPTASAAIAEINLILGKKETMLIFSDNE